MVDENDIQLHINEYHKILEDPKAENITLSDEFIVGLLIGKLLESWKVYKQQLKHKHKQLSLPNPITHIIIEDTKRKEIKVAKANALASRANFVQSKNRHDSIKPDHVSYVPKVTNTTFKRKGTSLVCGKPGHLMLLNTDIERGMTIL